MKNTAIIIEIVEDINNDILLKQINVFKLLCLEDIYIIHNDNSKLVKDFQRLGITFFNIHTNTKDEYFEKIKAKYDKVFYFNNSIGVFKQKTIKSLLLSKYDIVKPSFNNKIGMPILLNAKHLNNIDNLSEFEILEVNDNQILNEDNIVENELPVHYNLRIRLMKNEVFYGPGTHQLLKLIDLTNSVKQASTVMGISYSKAWRMLKRIEDELEDEVVIKQHGGVNGGCANLSIKGKYLISEYDKFLDECHKNFTTIQTKFFKNL